MKKNILFFVKYYVFWLVFFLLFKVLFLFGNFALTKVLSFPLIIDIFRHGFVMDLSAAGYCTLIVGVILLFIPYFPKVSSSIIKYYTFILILLLTVLGLADIAIYPAWGTRIDSQILPYLSQPKEVIASASFKQLILFFILLLIIVSCAYIIFKRMFKNYFSDPYIENKKWIVSSIILFFTVMLILPIRGGINTAPLNYSSVYFSDNHYANNSAYNFFWGFAYSLSHNQYNKNPVNYMSDQKCNEVMRGVDGFSQEKVPQMIINRVNGKPINVVMVILESFSDKVIYSLGGKSITPRLNEFCHEGICFNNFYATGSRSDRGISSLLAGYPALIKASSILGFPDKMRTLDYLPAYFSRRGYDMSFYYGGDANFYNTNILMIQSGVKRIVERSTFPMKQATMQKWGVPDEYLYAKLGKDINSMKKPFFTMVYNISSHEPFDIPNFNKINGQSNGQRYCNAVAYTDSCLGVFVDNLKKSPFWKNTLIIITSDHTSLYPEPQSDIEKPNSYKIPMIWLGGVVKKNYVQNNICSQTDLSATLVQQMGWKFKPTYFSKNMFGSHQFAFYFRVNGWGFLSPNIGYFQNIDTKKKRMFWEKQTNNDSLNVFAEAFTQFLHKDFIKR